MLLVKKIYKDRWDQENKEWKIVTSGWKYNLKTMLKKLLGFQVYPPKAPSAENVHAFIREWISSAYSPEVAEKITIIYGGSVNCHNSKMLLSQPNINGALVGGASLDPSQIVNI